MVKPKSAVQQVFEEIANYETVSVSRLARHVDTLLWAAHQPDGTPETAMREDEEEISL